MQTKDKFVDRLHDYLFVPGEQLPEHFDSDELQKVIRIRDGYTVWLEDPTQTDKRIKDYLVKNYSIKDRQAYYDVTIIKLLIGNVSVAAKDFQRFTAVNMLKKGFEMVSEAENNLQVKQGEAMIKAAQVLGKITRCDQDDEEPLPFDKIVPQTFEITGDVSVLGIEPIENLEVVQSNMRKKYGKIEDADIISNDEK